MAQRKNIYYRDWSELPILLKLSECAVILNVSYDTVLKWANNGILPAKKIADEWRVEKGQLKSFFEKAS